jgi:hypothetical protein
VIRLRYGEKAVRGRDDKHRRLAHEKTTEPRKGTVETGMFTLMINVASSPANVASDNPQVEIFKSFRVAINDPCEVVLPVVSFLSPLPETVAQTAFTSASPTRIVDFHLFVTNQYLARPSNATTSTTTGANTRSTSSTAIKSAVSVLKKSLYSSSNSSTRKAANPCSCCAATPVHKMVGVALQAVAAVVGMVD